MLLNSFFVAMHHSQRSEWRTQIAAFIKQGGYLITLVFPIEPKKDGGPPWCARAEHYDTPPAGTFEKVLDKVPEMLAPGWSEGKPYLLVWKRIRKVIQSASGQSLTIIFKIDAVLNIHAMRNENFE